MLSVEKLVELSRQRGLDGICLTEHDRFWPPDELAALRRALDFPLFAAVELTTDMGHILAYGLRDGHGPLATAEAAFVAAQEDGALLFLAHPARDGRLRVDRRTVEYFVSVEAVNGSDSRLQNLAATGLAHGFRQPGIGGSDAHTPLEVGRAATRFASIVTTDEELVNALRAGSYAAELVVG
jgi:hypothetical protein